MLHCFVIILVIVNVHEFISGRITEIAASHYGHLSACLAHLTSTCFMYVHSYALFYQHLADNSYLRFLTLGGDNVMDRA